MDEQQQTQLIEDLKRKHGVNRVHVITTPDGETVYVRAPAQGVWRRFRAEMQDDRRNEMASERLMRACLLHPDMPSFDAMLEDRPALLDTFASELCEIAGLVKHSEKKVL